MPDSTFNEILGNNTDLVFNHSPGVTGYVSSYAHVDGMGMIITCLVIVIIELAVICWNTVPSVTKS